VVEEQPEPVQIVEQEQQSITPNIRRTERSISIQIAEHAIVFDNGSGTFKVGCAFFVLLLLA
jgi:hypothetical protein